MPMRPHDFGKLCCKKKNEIMSRKGISVLCAGLRKKANCAKQIKDFRSYQYFSQAMPNKVSQASCLPLKNKVCEQDAHNTLHLP
jgi:hypothetical protein